MIGPGGKYIYVWVSCESFNTSIWFDDVKVTHTSPAMLVQATDYGVRGDVLREQKTDESEYRFGYQGQFAEKDEETGWNHFELREYDPVIGRWLVPDPYGVHWSPYLAMNNNPVNSVDPNGGCETGNCPDVGAIKDGLMWNGSDWISGYSHEITVTASLMTAAEKNSFDNSFLQIPSLNLIPQDKVRYVIQDKGHFPGDGKSGFRLHRLFKCKFI